MKKQTYPNTLVTYRRGSLFERILDKLTHLVLGSRGAWKL